MPSAATSPPDSIKAYTRLGLHVYDPLVMGVLARRVWECPPERLVDHYRAHVTPNHADIGVGTGYCLDRCGLPCDGPRLALIDLAPSCLSHAAQRLARYRPRCYLRDVSRPLPAIDGAAFDSVGVGGVLHCLSGELSAKGAVFDNLSALTAPGTQIFGYTLVSDGVRCRRSARLVHGVLNRTRVIHNASDRVTDLQAVLAARFVDCRVDLVGCMALFSARVPIRLATQQRTLS